ncbi:MAG: zinc-binding dehydrogenase [Lewinellaceae bacterium]|nr:zinc-binding dehydrogenase [Lewinella sp.]MCB9281719.1 zinc-binding dehydrogenase [Lewinellaceae bacterium]
MSRSGIANPRQNPRQRLKRLLQLPNPRPEEGKLIFDGYRQLFDAGSLHPVIDSVFDWHEAVRAHLYMENNRNQGKIVLKIPQ